MITVWPSRNVRDFKKKSGLHGGGAADGQQHQRGPVAGMGSWMIRQVCSASGEVIAKTGGTYTSVPRQSPPMPLHWRL